MIQLSGNQAKPSCELYRLYFFQHLGEANERKSAGSNQIWERERLSLTTNSDSLDEDASINIKNIDKLTQLITWQYLNKYLETHWQQWAKEMTVLSLIVCEVDYLKFYTDAYGQLTGDSCIQRIASTINDCVRHQAILVARYGETKFAALLPHTDATVSVEIAELVREQVKALGLIHDQ
ncbi:hypothetical protein B7486_48965 [cyanobacterium TDX16]|nr:hypothetical protein B7486_48965 [cyanobacterium TDX16]